MSDNEFELPAILRVAKRQYRRRVHEDAMMNAEGYCRTCKAPLGISGQCDNCAIDRLAKERVDFTFSPYAVLSVSYSDEFIDEFGQAFGRITWRDGANRLVHTFLPVEMARKLDPAATPHVPDAYIYDGDNK